MIQFVTNGLCAGLGLAPLALGFALIYQSTRVFHVAHAAVYAASAYAAYGLVSVGSSPLVAVAPALIAATGLGLLFELMVYRPLRLRDASPLVTLVASFGIYIASAHSFAMLAGNEAKAISSSLLKTWQIEGLTLNSLQAAQVVTGLVSLMVVGAYLRYSRSGRWTRALASNRELVLALGGNEPALRVSIFSLGSLLGAAAGLLAAWDSGLYPYMGFSPLLLAAAAAILAGSGRFLMAGAAAVAIALLRNLFLLQLSPTWNDAIVSAAFLIALSLRRGTLGASAERDAV